MHSLIVLGLSLYFTLGLTQSFATSYSQSDMVQACRTLDYPLVKAGIPSTLSVKDYLQQLDQINQSTADYEVLSTSRLGYSVNSPAFHNWGRMQLPHELLRKSNLTQYFYSSREIFSHPNVNLSDTRTWPQHFENYNPSTVRDFTAKELDRWKGWIAKMKEGRKNGEGGAFNHFMKFRKYIPSLGCKAANWNSKISKKQCKESLDRIIEEDFPSYIAVFLEDTIQEVMTKRSYRAPAIRAAKRLIETFNDRNLPTESAFNLLLSEFQKEGLSREDAITHSINILGSLSVIGPDLYLIFMWNFDGTQPVATPDPTYHLALRVLGYVPPVLDIRQFARAPTSGMHSSAIASSASTHCQFGKYYYFWQTAYWMWHHGKDLNSHADQNGVILGIWSLLKNYQKFSDGPGRVPFASLGTDSNSTLNHQIRRDLTLGMAGMLFVRDLIRNPAGTPKAISVDEMYLKIWNQSQSIKIDNFEERRDAMMSCFKGPDLGCLISAVKTMNELEDKWEHVIQADSLLKDL